MAARDTRSTFADMGTDRLLRQQCCGLLTMAASGNPTAASRINELTLPTRCSHRAEELQGAAMCCAALGSASHCDPGFSSYARDSPTICRKNSSMRTTFIVKERNTRNGATTPGTSRGAEAWPCEPRFHTTLSPSSGSCRKRNSSVRLKEVNASTDVPGRKNAGARRKGKRPDIGVSYKPNRSSPTSVADLPDSNRVVP